METEGHNLIDHIGSMEKMWEEHDEKIHQIVGSQSLLERYSNKVVNPNFYEKIRVTSIRPDNGGFMSTVLSSSPGIQPEPSTQYIRRIKIL